MTRPTMLDLFAGCGGMTSGFRSEGFESRGAVEYELAPAATFAVNFGEAHTHWIDIANWADDEIPKADIVIGGPPCQGFSNLGSRDSADPRNKLWKEYVRVLRVARPQLFVIENVDRFHTSSEFQLLQDQINGGDLRDYEIVSAVLNSADFGVPQRRRRTIVIGSRVGPPQLPQPTFGKGKKPWRSVRSAIGDLADTEPVTTHLPEGKVEYFGAKIPGVFREQDLHLGRNPTELSLLRYDCVPPGGGRFDLPDELLPNCWRNKPTGTTDVMGRMEWDKPSLTIRTEFFKPEKGKYLHPQWDPEDPDNRVNRPITHLEAARLQTFPRRFKWCGTKTEIARQIGNAVPPRFARAIARSVKNQLQ